MQKLVCGKTASKIKNIVFSDKSIEEPEIIETLNQDRTEAAIEIKYPENAVKKEYMIIDKDGNESELMEYVEGFSVTEDGTTIYAVATNIAGETKDATHTVYLSMVRPVITVEVNSNKTEAKVGISYDSTAIRKEYKIVDENRNEIKGLTSYTGQFIVKENRVYVIAEEENQNGVVIKEEAFIKMDMSSPVINGEVSIKDGEKVATINIEYDRSGVSNKYKIIKANGEESELLDYQGSFEVKENGTIIYAVGRNERGEEKDATYTVKIGLDDALINQRIEVDTNNNEVAKVSIVYDPTSVVKKYRVDGGEWLEYSGEFVVGKHLAKVEALSQNIENEEKIAQKTIEIPVDKPTISIDMDEEDKSFGIVVIDYDEHASKKEYTIDEGLGEGKLTYEYTGPITVRVNGTKIQATNENKAGDSKTSDEFVVSKIEEESGIRFMEPVISGIVEDDETGGKIVRISIEYDESAIRKEYKIISKTGEESEFVNYESTFVIKNNGTVIYAEEEDENGNIKGATYTVTGAIENIEVKIIIEPDTQEKVEKVKVRIEYADKATSRKYRISGESQKEYTGEFYVDRNCTITAIGIGEEAQGQATRQITNLANGLVEPVINVVKKKETGGQYAQVTIKYDEESVNNTYSIDGESTNQYNGMFEVRKNGTIVEAISVDKFGNVTKTQKEIELTRYVIIDKGKYQIIELTYPEESINRMYKYKEDGIWKNYPEKYGFVLIKDEYEEELLKDNTEIILEASDGTLHSFKGHYYIYSGILDEDEIYMRFDIKSGRKEKPWLVPLTQSPGESVEIAAMYPPDSVKREYRVGTTGEWKEYTGPILVTKNYTLVYARATFADGDKTMATYYVSNLHIAKPDGDINIEYTPKEYTREVEVTIKFNPKYENLINRYRVVGGTWIETSSNEVTFKIQKNTTIYASFKNANGNVSSAVTLKITNIDTKQPTISILRIGKQFVGINDIKYKITIGDELSGADISKCKYILTKQSTVYSEDDPIWEEAFSINSAVETVNPIPTQGSGKYHLHVLAVDRAGNKKTKMSITVSEIDVDPPNDAVIVFDKSEAVSGEEITASIVLDNSDVSGINIKNSKYIYSSHSTAYGEDNAIWDGADSIEKLSVENGKRKLRFSSITSGDYYVHVLSVDNSGNKKETVSSKVSVISRDETIYISTTGNDILGDGTIKNPYATYHRAISVAKNNSIICFLPGTYNLTPISVSFGMGSGYQESIGIYDYNKSVEIYGYNEATILRYNPTQVTTYGRCMISLGNSNSKVRNLTIEYYPTKSMNYGNHIFRNVLGKVHNVHFKILGSLANYASLKRVDGAVVGSSTNIAYNCAFYFSTTPTGSAFNSPKMLIMETNLSNASRFITRYDKMTYYVSTDTLDSMKTSSYGLYNGMYAWPK